MKFKLFIVVLMLAAAAVAQTATPAAPDTKSCACCSHDKADGSAQATGCKDGKCPMMSGSHEPMKCPMMAKDEKMSDGKICCASNKCPMHAKGDKSSGCCCGTMDGHQHPGI